jgi:hypothetical protein
MPLTSSEYGLGAPLSKSEDQRRRLVGPGHSSPISCETRSNCHQLMRRPTTWHARRGLAHEWQARSDELGFGADAVIGAPPSGE